MLHLEPTPFSLNKININYDEIIDNFVELKTRKHNF